MGQRVPSIYPTGQAWLPLSLSLSLPFPSFRFFQIGFRKLKGKRERDRERERERDDKREGSPCLLGFVVGICFLFVCLSGLDIYIYISHLHIYSFIIWCVPTTH